MNAFTKESFKVFDSMLKKITPGFLYVGVIERIKGRMESLVQYGATNRNEDEVSGQE